VGAVIRKTAKKHNARRMHHQYLNSNAQDCRCLRWATGDWLPLQAQRRSRVAALAAGFCILEYYEPFFGADDARIRARAIAPLH
jgi:hypothetical protein